MKLSKIFVVLFLGSIQMSCGVKGKPLPPEEPIIMKKDRWTDLEKKKKEKQSENEAKRTEEQDQ